MLHNKILRIAILTLLVVFACAFLNELSAQCPMCKTNLEGAMQSEGNSVGAGINHGIIYLFMAPFLAAGTIGFFWYRASKQQKA